jgi:hypothetical protein
MRLVEFTTNPTANNTKGQTFSIHPVGLQVWPGRRPVDHVMIRPCPGKDNGIFIQGTYQEAVDKINAALEPERVPAAKAWKVRTIGEAIREMRHIANMGHDELVSRINRNIDQVTEIESNHQKPDLETIEVICVVTNCSLTVAGHGFVVQERGDNE